MSQKSASQLKQEEFLKEIQAVMDEAPDLYKALAEDKFD